MDIVIPDHIAKAYADRRVSDIEDPDLVALRAMEDKLVLTQEDREVIRRTAARLEAATTYFERRNLIG